MPPTLIDRFLFAGDISPERMWELLDWCRTRGASQLTVSELLLEGQGANFVDRFDREMTAFALAAAGRPQMERYRRQEMAPTQPLWALTDGSVAVLRQFFADGLFMHPTSKWEKGCLEDPTFYREGQIMLGIVSHEGEGVLRLSAAEHDEIAAMGFSTLDRAKWI